MTCKDKVDSTGESPLPEPTKFLQGEVLPLKGVPPQSSVESASIRTAPTSQMDGVVHLFFSPRDVSLLRSASTD